MECQTELYLLQKLVKHDLEKVGKQERENKSYLLY